VARSEAPGPDRAAPDGGDGDGGAAPERSWR